MTKIVVNAMCMGQNRENQAVDVKRKIEEGVQVMRPQTRPQIDVATIAWSPPSPPPDVSTQHRDCTYHAFYCRFYCSWTTNLHED